MRIAAYLHYYPPLRYVGGELASAEFFEHLVGVGHKVDVYAKFVSTPYTRRGVRVMNSGFLGPVVARDYDLFVTHPEIRTEAMRLADQRVPYVAIVHNTSAETLRSLERQAPDLTFANSEWTASKIPTSVENVHVVRPLSFRREYGHPPGEYVTMINLSVEKGVGMFSQLAQRHPLYNFIGVKGGYRTQTEARELPPNVLVLEHTPNIEVAYRKTKVLLVPSLAEAYGMVVAEAMQYGIPVIASDLPGIREVGGDAPIYCAPEDYPAWSQSLDLLMGDPIEWAARSLRSTERGTYLYQRSRADLDTLITEMRRAGDRCACGLVTGADECQIPCGLSARTSRATDGL